MKIITIGRSSHCDIIINNDQISRVHAQLSLVGNQYVYKDMSKNGTNIGGRVVQNEKVVIAPGSQVFLANKIPLPWAQIYTLLPMSGAQPFEKETEVNSHKNYEERYRKSNSEYDYGHGGRGYRPDELAIGWGILSFLVPLVGWILYFCWKSETPKRASQAATWAWIGFGVGLLLQFIA